MSTLKETIYAGRNNTIRLLLSEDDQLFHVAYPDVTPTRWVFTVHAATPRIRPRRRRRVGRPSFPRPTDTRRIQKSWAA